jgi:hypothetical protein
MLFGSHEFGDLTVTPGLGTDPVHVQMEAAHQSGVTCSAWESLSEPDVRRLISVLEEAIER